MTAASTKLSRRNLLLGAGAASVVAPAYLRAQQPGKVVYATWGGSWERALKKAWFEPFTSKTGIEVVTTGQVNSYGKIQAMVQSGNVEWDVVEISADFQFLGAKKNLFEKLNFNVIDASGVMPGKDIVTEFAVPQVVFSMAMFYNTKSFPSAARPHAWKDVWDVARLPGKRLFSSARLNHGSLEAALMADGVPMDAVFPLDIDRALKSLTKIREHILWSASNGQSEQIMSDGQAVTGMAGDGRAFDVKARGAPIEVEYNESILTRSSMIIPRGSKNREAAMQLLNYTLTPEAQAAIAMEYSYGPVVPKAFDLIPPERAVVLSGGPQQRGKCVISDELWWAENLPQATEKFNAWRLG